MKRDNDSYKLTDKNYFDEETDKYQIVLLDSGFCGMDHINLWENINSVGYKKTSPYTIGLDGTVYEHYDSKYWSKVFGIKDIDRKLIPISLENEGQLRFCGKKKKFITWWGDIYRRGKDDVHMKKWRGGVFWAPYTDEQLESLVTLVKELSIKHNIELKVKSGEDDIDFLENYLGIVTKSDYGSLCNEINPSFDRITFKEKIEKL